MATVSIDIDKTKNEIYLYGDIYDLKNNRFAWRYIKSYLDPVIDSDRICIAIGEKQTYQILSDIRAMLIKYGFDEVESETSEQVLRDFYEEEQKFLDFSKKALDIRNNVCSPSEFSSFSDSIIKNLPARSLYPLQLLSAYHMAFSQNACNFSVPGSGKTSIVYGAYAYLKNLADDHPKKVDCILIVGPLSSFGPWEMEYEECFGKTPSVKRLIGALKREDKIDYLYSSHKAEITMISYSSVASLMEALVFFLKYNRVMVVLDEAHKAKNTSGGVIAQSILQVSEYCKSRIVLTGTPAPNGYEDLYNMFKFIWPNKNVIGFQVNQLRDMTTQSNDSRIARMIEYISPYFIRIKKSDLDIPPAITHQPILVKMGPAQQRIYEFIEKQYVDAMLNEGKPDTSSRFRMLLIQARIVRLMQAATNPAMLKTPLIEFLEDDECPQEAFQAINDTEVLKAILDFENIETPSKYLAAKELVDSIIATGGKVVIWATFIHTILNLQNFLANFGIAAQVLYGAIPVEQEGIGESENQILTRERIVREFQDERCPFKVLIANPFAVAESISLHKACHHAIYIERSFNVAHFVQSKDRIHRYGLKEHDETHYYFILANDSVDETINDRLQIKELRMTEIMETMPIPLFSNISEDLGDEDIKALIKDYVRRTKKS